MNTRFKAPQWLVAGVIFACCLVILHFTHKLSLDRALQTLSQQTQLTADLFSANIESTVNRYSYLPRVLATNPANLSVLKQPTRANTLELSLELEKANTEAGTLNIYLMSRDGTTLASSNHAESDSFVGKNFAFRPYFHFAINGANGRYFALGATTGKRGYYFSSPVLDPESNEILGVSVVKAGLEQLEESWVGKQPMVLLTDQYDVVFSGNQNNWFFQSLSRLSPNDEEALQKSRQYYGISVKAIERIKHSRHSDFALLTSRDEASAGEYLHLKNQISRSGWWQHTLADTAPARRAAWESTLSATILLAFISALTLYFLQRRKTFAILQRTKASLEAKVATRTSALTVANDKLTQEAYEKETAYKALRDAQDKLLHSSRLATIGEMSTAITHELNQPITAISAYAQNAHEFLAQGNTEPAKKNMTAITDLSQRMAEITTLLRNHARKEEEQHQTIEVSVAINNALSIVKPKADSMNIAVNTRISEKITLNTSPTRLEQILVNLLANACDALADTSVKEIRVSAEKTASYLEISVCDSGNGVPEELLHEVFEPFFTTKGSSRGLGLGLSISQSIANNLNGSLTAKNNTNQGACFSLRLPLHEQPNE